MDVYCLRDYDWECGTLLPSKGKKVKILLYSTVVVHVDREKCADPDELVVIVWERWRGRNGRGGYRVEREMYRDHARPAREIGRRRGPGRVMELEHGKLDVQPMQPDAGHGIV